MQSSNDSKPNQPEWSAILKRAVNEPGAIHSVYTAFHGYSLGNRILAMFQCALRGIPAGPIATFMGWKEKGRHVRKGEKALTLCMPVPGKRKLSGRDPETGAETEETVGYTRFVYLPNWFVLSQTDGAEDVPDVKVSQQWDESRALQTLEVARVPFEHTDGNCQGYAMGKSIAVSPVAYNPQRTLFHELAHDVLGHTAEGSLSDTAESTPRDIRELEAECTALLCLSSLRLPGEEYSRGYIQSWFRGNDVPERSAHRIFTAADKILKAGITQE